MNCGLCSIVKDFDVLCDSCFLDLKKESKILDVLMREGPGWQLLYDTYNRRYNKFLLSRKSEKKLLDRKFVFITLQDFKTKFTDVEKLVQFCKRIKYLYYDYYYVIESGSCEDQALANYHVHLFAKIKNTKGHKRSIKAEWARLFNRDITAEDYYDVKQWRESESMPPYEQWHEEKIEYMRKGTNAKNAFPSICGGCA